LRILHGVELSTFEVKSGEKEQDNVKIVLCGLGLINTGVMNDHVV
jgi:hypothetical protein